MKTISNVNTGALDDVLSIYRKKQVREILLKFTFSLIFAFLMWISANSFVYLPFTPVPMTMQVLTALIAPFFIGSCWAVFSQITYISLGLAGLPVFSGFKSGIAAITGPTGGYILGFIAAGFVTGYICSVLKTKNSSLNSAALKNHYHNNSNDDDNNKNKNENNNKNNVVFNNINNKFLDSRNLLEINDLAINENNENIDKKAQITFIACLSGLAVIYIFGFLHLLGYLSAFGGGTGLKELAFKTFKLGIQPFIIVDLLKITIIVNILGIFGIRN
ncbi:MAG: biotin transporter BioY [Actinobacteria bacterium]|nr:biotin transporter BioY [Actinomycetota bacterium]MBM3713116.1 biotin transporter BioY [Actinomycetota bacterium]